MKTNKIPEPAKDEFSGIDQIILEKQETKCSKAGCDKECFKGETFENDGKNYCSAGHLPKQETWEKNIQTAFGNGQKENETISGYLGDLLAKIRQEVIKDYLKSEEGKVYQDYQTLREEAKKEESDKFRKILNSGKSMYELGKKESRREVIKEIEKWAEGRIWHNYNDKKNY